MYYLLNFSRWGKKVNKYWQFYSKCILQTEKVIYFATEAVIPLESYLNENDENRNLMAISWGIHQVAVSFSALQKVTIYMYLTEWKKRIKWLSFSFFLFAFQKGLSFLINDCNLIHNNVCLSSVFVNQAGEWKLGGVDYMYPAQGQDSVPPVKILPLLDKYDPPEKVENRRGVRTEKW